MANNKLAKLEKNMMVVAEMQPIDLQSKEKVDALVKLAAEVADEKKAITERDTEIKNNFKRMCKQQIEEGKNVTCYSWDEGKKMTLTMVGGSAEISESALLDKLYEAYGEERGDRNGRAWAAFMAVTDPIEIPRVLNADKLEAELARAERIAAGIDDGNIIIDRKIVEAATEYKAPTPTAKLSNISKAEMEEHDKSGFCQVFVEKQ